ncbi:hypothetical protein ACH5RR_012882 [Cinchona calisaya]|uniref:hAT-like transposase RNase-H fold domain-containing protein n=1 Tax=Cinchona calisaya TaxID=153742 RepID=A0ABD3A8U0_9GENT
MASPMKEKFEKYWDECCLVLVIAVVFDPRFKLALVEYNYNSIYGENAKKYVDRVRCAIADLFVEYGGELNPSFGYACGSDVEESNFTGANKESDDIRDDMFSNFDKWYYRSKSSTIRDYQKSELQVYLEEPVASLSLLILPDAALQITQLEYSNSFSVAFTGTPGDEEDCMSNCFS